MNTPTPLLDVLGIGFGPANLALAIALEELAPDLSVRFLERRDGPHWQPGMLLPGSDIQNHPLRDLVTPRNPRSRYSFTNFLFENQRLYEHLNLPLHYPLRLEYAQYVKWVAQFFTHQVDYQREAVSLEAVAERGGYYRVTTADGSVYHARSLAFAPGRTPHVPAPFAGLQDSRIRHLNHYLPSLAATLEHHPEARVAVIGGSQSAVEILLHASEQAGVAHLVGYTRNFGYRQKDTSPFSDEVYFPGFVDAFHAASPENKARLRRELVHTNYSASDIDVLNQLYVRRYEDRLHQRQRINLHTCQEILACRPGPDAVELESQHFLSGEVSRQRFDLVVLATGFLDLGSGDRQEPWPPLLAPLAQGHDTLTIARDYRVALPEHPPLYFNGLCESSHGMGDAGSFSLLALRSQSIVESLQQQLAPPRAALARVFSAL
ncbi:SidA/IucD/PvdA family monooxygenase [Pseudomonas sp. RP23018S]|uniref:SidA/IucD/PvdA family monooxygenase n=1 Tax=Pseudomonas sp. RP23018S TaxID=3096037 RepID=UPI002ACAC7DC|nr:SidA/IucD/PvdA family monooxygenase [Pseudomonas sp. RP23018S]MDZ5603143.1 SidA/IucD/PvdA family monooxygenase [Pseudomonas sp. RP23018S]